MQTHECLLQKVFSCDNDPAKSFTLKANKDTANAHSICSPRYKRPKKLPVVS